MVSYIESRQERGGMLDGLSGPVEDILSNATTWKRGVERQQQGGLARCLIQLVEVV